MNLKTGIQFYDGKKDNKGIEISVEFAIERISNAAYKSPVNLKEGYKQIQLLKEQGAAPEAISKLQQLYDEAKGKLPCVTWAGTFTKRSINGIKEYSQLIVLDIDKLSNEDFRTLRTQLCQDPYTFICFTSPSGVGIKLVFKLQDITTPLLHKITFESIQKYLFDRYAVPIDISGKDISRLCFLCHDPNVYVNTEATIYEIPNTHDPVNVEVEGPKASLNKKQQTQLHATEDDLYSVIHFTDKISSYTEGNRNNYVHLFACNANRKGFSLNEVQGFAQGHFQDLKSDELTSTINSAYQNNTSEFGKFKKQQKKSLQTSSAPSAVATIEKQKKYTEFWKERRIKKGKGVEQYEVTTYELKRVEFTDFLFEQGFHLIDTDSQGYQICHSQDGIITPVEPRHIKKKVFAWCKDNLDREIEEMLRKGQKQFFAANEMDALHTKNVAIKADTEAESYFYFNNCWVAVSQDGIFCKPYAELDQFIWAGTKKTHEFTFEEPMLLDKNGNYSLKHMNCEFARFIHLVGWNPNNPDEKNFDMETIEQRFECICSAIGFMLDGYKHPADRKAIFAVDHKIGEMGEQNGRTGKSIIPKAIENLKVVASISGKNFDPKYQFRYEPITMDSQVVNFNDMPKNFDVETIFEVIADDYSVNRRNNGFLHYRYDQSPKVWVSTNFTPKGAGDSYSARMHIIEFSDYFNAKHSPYNEFGHGMFSSAWDQAEWNRFYNFMLWCAMLYKCKGLVSYPNSNFDARKLANEVNAEFIDFMDSDKVPRNKRLKKLELLEEFNKEYSQLYSAKLKPHTFYKWIRQYCKHHQLFFNPEKNGSRHVSNNIEYYTIATTPDFVSTEPDHQEPPTLFNA